MPPLCRHIAGWLLSLRHPGRAVKWLQLSKASVRAQQKPSLTALPPGLQVLKRGSELSSNSNDSEQLAVHGRHGLGGRASARSATRHRCAV